MTRRKLFFLSITIAAFLIVCGGILALHSSFFIPIANLVTEHVFKFTIQAASLSFSGGVAAEVTNLAINDTAKDRFEFSSAKLNIQSRPLRALSGEIERIVLKQPKVRIRIGNRKDTETDLSFIKKIPSVDLLIVEKGQLTILFTQSMQEIVLNDIDLTVRHFSPEKGGSLLLRAGLDMADRAKNSINVHGSIASELNLSSITPRPLGKGSIHADFTEGSVKNLIFGKTVLDLPVFLEKNRIRIPGADISAASMSIRNRDNSGIRKTVVKTGVSYNIDSQTISVEDLEGQAQGLGDFTISGSMAFKGTKPFDARIEASKVDFSNMYNLLRGFIAEEDLNKWSVHGKGQLTADVEGSYTDRPTLKGKASVKFQQGGFSSEDGSKAADGVDGSITVRFDLPSGQKKREATIFSQFSGGEYLWDKYYLDAKAQPSSLNLEADIAVNRQGDSRISGTVGLFNTGSYDYTIHKSHDQSNILLDAREVSVKKLASVFLRDFLVGVDPSYRGMNADGRLDTSLEAIVSRNGLSLKGFVRLTDVNLEIPERSLQMTGLDADLPVELTDGNAETVTYMRGKSDARKGTIRFRTLATPFLQLLGINVSTDISGNAIAFPDPISLPVYGGHIYITDARISSVLNKSRRLSFSGRIEGVDFGPMLSKASGITFPEPVEIVFPIIHFSGGTIETEGQTLVRMFGGQIVASRIFGEDIFSHTRKIGGDINFNEIDLGKVTDAVKLGKITGVVQGSVHNLLIQYGQPSQFVFEVKTAEDSKAAKKVSVDAIENISILGTGSGGISAILKSGLNRFFKEYPYSRIGIKCSLENDIFTVRGTIHENDEEYLIRRGFLRGIDVINKDPENVVSFKDMQERISRVFRERKDEEAKTIVVN
ncbi:MAG TPA: hypothetical protein VHO84_05185 [Syntrophorhabdaceae bacterium]|nr:hypothetical protein [Syntrophorhabdaceae bacterium]